MTTTIIANSPPYNFGRMTNQAITGLVGLNGQLSRLQEAIATASSGFGGTAGTQFEVGGGLNTPAFAGGAPANLFGVQASETPGEQGLAYSYAMGQLSVAWETFWTAAAPYVQQLDNGTA